MGVRGSSVVVIISRQRAPILGLLITYPEGREQPAPILGLLATYLEGQAYYSSTNRHSSGSLGLYLILKVEPLGITPTE